MMGEDLFTGLFILCLLGVYFGAGGFVLWLLDKALSRVPRYRDWKENLLGKDDYVD
jgi:hypothetical protein